MNTILNRSSKYITILLALVWFTSVYYIYVSKNVVLTPKIGQYAFLMAYIFVLRAFGEKIFELLKIKAQRYPSVPKIILDLAMGTGIFNLATYVLLLLLRNVTLSVLLCMVLVFVVSFSNINKTFLRILILENKINLLELKKREIMLFTVIALLGLCMVVLAHTPAVNSEILQGELSRSKQILLSDELVMDKLIPPLNMSFYLPFLYMFPSQTINVSLFNAVIILCITIMLYYISYYQGAQSRVKSLFGSIIFLSAPMIMYLGTIPGTRPVNLLYFTCTVYIVQQLQKSWSNIAQYIVGIFLVFITNSLGLGILYSLLILIYIVLAKLDYSRVLVFFIGSIFLFLSTVLRFIVLIPVQTEFIIREIDASVLFELFSFPFVISLFNKIATDYLPIGPVLLIFLPFIMFYYIKYLKNARAIILIMVIGILFIFIRFNFKDFMPAYIYACLITTEVVYRLYKNSRVVAFFLILFFLSISIINMIGLFQFYIEEYDPIKVVFGLEKFEDFIGNRLSDYADFPLIEQYLSEKELLLVCDDLNHFYFTKPFISMSLSDDKALSIIKKLSQKTEIVILKRQNHVDIPGTEVLGQVNDLKLLKYLKGD